MSKDTNLPSTEEMAIMIKADRQLRQKRATDKINQVLTEERCEINPIMTLTSKGIQAGIVITAKEQ